MGPERDGQPMRSGNRAQLAAAVAPSLPRFDDSVGPDSTTRAIVSWLRSPEHRSHSHGDREGRDERRRARGNEIEATGAPGGPEAQGIGGTVETASAGTHSERSQRFGHGASDQQTSYLPAIYIVEDQDRSECVRIYLEACDMRAQHVTESPQCPLWRQSPTDRGRRRRRSGRRGWPEPARSRGGRRGCGGRRSGDARRGRLRRLGRGPRGGGRRVRRGACTSARPVVVLAAVDAVGRCGCARAKVGGPRGGGRLRSTALPLRVEVRAVVASAACSPCEAQ
jgi:hypothetical protein